MWELPEHVKLHLCAFSGCCSPCLQCPPPPAQYLAKHCTPSSGHGSTAIFSSSPPSLLQAGPRAPAPWCLGKLALRRGEKPWYCQFSQHLFWKLMFVSVRLLHLGTTQAQLESHLLMCQEVRTVLNGTQPCVPTSNISQLPQAAFCIRATPCQPWG